MALLIASSGYAGISDINPDTSDNGNANASSGGRVNGLANASGNNQVYYAASEYGGIFKTTDGGNNWARLNAFLPVMAWDVEVDPSNNNRVYATSWYDGRVNSLAGIQVSTNAGASWTKPATSTPPGPTTARRSARMRLRVRHRSRAWRQSERLHRDELRRCEEHRLRRDVDLRRPDSGHGGRRRLGRGRPERRPRRHLRKRRPPALDRRGRELDCGRRARHPDGRCSIAASPDESYVLFVVAGDDSCTRPTTPAPTGRTSARTATRPHPVRRDEPALERRHDGPLLPLVRGHAALPRRLHDADSAGTGGAKRCGNPSGYGNQQTGAHWDAGARLRQRSGVDSCPMIYSSDGGVHRRNAGCESPTWVRSNAGVHALFIWSGDGASQAGNANRPPLRPPGQRELRHHERRRGLPTWTNPHCCDTFDVLADPAWELGSICCSQLPGRLNILERAVPAIPGTRRSTPIRAREPSASLRGATGWPSSAPMTWR